LAGAAPFDGSGRQCRKKLLKNRILTAQLDANLDLDCKRQVVAENLIL
jgi:hypothetical protein